MDDLQLKLQRNLSKLVVWFEENKLYMHLGKMESPLFGSKTKLLKNACMNIYRVNNSDIVANSI